MIKKTIIILLIIALCGLWSVSFAARSHLGSPTKPASSRRSGLIPSRSERGYAERNLAITGNVAGGRHFRGIVPYRSTSEFADTLGSTSLNSFIRRSAGTPYRSSPGRSQPYYLPSRTVTSMRRSGRPGLAKPKITFSGGTGKFKPPLLTSRDTKAYFGVQRPLSRDTRELEKLIAQQLELNRLRRQSDDFLSTGKDDRRLKDLDIEPQLKLGEAEKSLEKTEDKTARPQQPSQAESPLTPQQLRERQSDIVDLAYPEWTEAEQFAGPESETPDQTQADRSNKYKLKLPAARELPQPNRTRAREVLKEYKTFENFAEARFNEYTAAAEEFMKQGEFYRAADAYTLAGIYDSDDPKALAGRAHALFAAGEYMSSSYFLERAITLSPEYAKHKTDLVDLLGDKDLLETRIVDIGAWHKTSGSGELAFLMAYVFYNTDKLSLAREAVADAAEKMADNPAVLSLKQAIETSKRGR